MDSNNIFFKVIVGVVLVGYMAFIFYQSLKGGIAYKKEFENFKNSHKHYETMVDGGYWVWVMVAMAVVAFVLMFMAPKLASNGQTYYYYLAYGCIGLVFLGLSIDHIHIVVFILQKMASFLKIHIIAIACLQILNLKMVSLHIIAQC